MIAVIRFDLLNGCVTEFDFSDLCDVESQGHNRKMDRVPQGPTVSYIPDFNSIAVRLLDLSGVFRQMDRRTDKQTDGKIWTNRRTDRQMDSGIT